MKKIIKLLFVFIFGIVALNSCNKDKDKETEWVDYVEQCKLDLTSGRANLTATVKTYVDGDTTHFTVTDSSFENYTLKARYLAIDTPESTGKVQPYGKAASNFTKEKLSSATSIILESATSNWNPDSTGSRYLVWVWYKTSDSDYRLLNLELLQNGYTAGKNYSDYEYYADYFSDAMTQAMEYNLRCLGNEKDPDFWYADAQEITLKELKLHQEDYKETAVRFDCTVGTVTSSNNFYTAYVYDYDEESDITFGFQVYLLTNYYKPFQTPGNRISICGTVLYYETGHVYQLSDISYNVVKFMDGDTYIINKYEVIKDFLSYKVGDIITTKAYKTLDKTYTATSAGYLSKIDEEVSAVYTPITADDLNGETKVSITTTDTSGNEVTNLYSKPLMMLHSTISIENLTIDSISTTTSSTSSSKGAMTFTCHDTNNKSVTVRTAVLKDENFNVITKDTYQGKTISVKGIIDYYSRDDEEIDDNGYQVKVFTPQDITIL